MTITRLLTAALALSFTLTAAAQRTTDYTRWVNPFIGTGGHGHTFPGATVPFGMVQLSPDTRIDNWDGSSGYHYSDDVIYGFSHTHLSGTGIPDGCDILFMPMVGGSKEFAEGFSETTRYKSKFSHKNERSEAGYYSVKLDEGDIFAELTSTQRVGMHRYSYPKTASPYVLLDLRWRDKLLDSKISAVGDRRIEGYRRSSSWAKDQTIYFVAEFSKPFDANVWNRPSHGASSIPPEGTLNYQWQLQFNLGADEKLLLKVAISYVSIEGARRNLEAELPHWDFDKVRADAKAAWNKELSKIEVTGGTEEQRTNFYTALYHTMIHPNVFNDVDGQYRGMDKRVHQLPRVRRAGSPTVRKGSPQPASTSAKQIQPSPGALPNGRASDTPGDHYTVFSLWDTFRAAHPLYTIIDQKRTVDYINTFIRMYEQGGRLPVWELWGEETDTMIGYHAVSVIADAMAKGIKGFDYEKAYKAAKHSAELDHFGLAGYKKRGYISMEDENESVSRTLEYAYNDWCLMSMAATLYNNRTLGSTKPVGPADQPYLKALEADVEHYKRRSGYYQNLFDSKTRFFRPRKNGGFVEPFAPNEVTFGFTEGNSWQYSFFVPHDVTGLMHLMGGTEKFVAKLDELFTTSQKLAGREQADLTGLIGQYAHGNEPSHHIAYLYNYAARPSRTQKYVRQIMDNFYKNAPDGLIGNEDCGQMSAWYVLSASGFYPVVPGEKRYDIGSPLFPEVTYRLENGKRFTIRAPKVSPTNIYIQSAKWNGDRLVPSYITQDHIMAGGVLEFEMGSVPNDKAFSGVSSSTVYRDEPAVPVIEGGGQTFSGTTTITMSTVSRNAEIYYSIGDGDFAANAKRYTGPITISSNTSVRAEAVRGGIRSLRSEARFIKRPNDWSVKVNSGYSRLYTGGGDNAIVDGIRGTTNFASGEWQGVQGKTYEAVIDLQRVREVKSVGASFLQVAGPWIWMPANIKFEISNNGSDWTEVAEIKPDFPTREMTPTIKEYRQSIAPTRARYVRLRATNFGKIPAWHPGAGGDPWIFIDEVFID